MQKQKIIRDGVFDDYSGPEKGQSHASYMREIAAPIFRRVWGQAGTLTREEYKAIQPYEQEGESALRTVLRMLGETKHAEALTRMDEGKADAKEAAQTRFAITMLARTI